jgi:DNA-binding transcriptional LysR family regulator
MVGRHLIIGTQDDADVIQNSGRGVRKSDTPAFFARLKSANWDDVYLFRSIADAASLRRAATNTGIAVNTVRDRITRLETALDTKLFTRGRQGLQLTQDGHSVMLLSGEMAALGKRMQSEGGEEEQRLESRISLCVSEGIGAFWLTPRLRDLRTLLPETRISLHNAIDQNGIHGSGHDLRIGFVRPTDLDAIVVKLATVHFVLCASEDYLRENGTPTSFDEAQKHVYIDQDSPGLRYDAVSMFVGSEQLERLVAYSVNSSFSLYWAVANGQGIAALPTYVRAISRRVRPLDLPVQMRFELWLSFDRGERQLEPVRKAVRWLRDCFDTAIYPWFRDEFVHPALFEQQLERGDIVPLYDYGIGDVK